MEKYYWFSGLFYNLYFLFQVKAGSENMIQMYSSGPMRDKKLLGEAQQMLADSRAKIEYIKMRIMKVKQAKLENGLDADGKPKCKESFF